ncbi:pilus assembly PilX N-terminal domain-containing protein [bacterium]|nr:pilus assembly PilX N-terminal domain-containing protein [bacterium]
MHLVKYEKGSSLIVVILVVSLLALMGLGLVMNTITDRAVARNMSATNKALFSAETGLERLNEMFEFDFAYDRTGFSETRGWSNVWLLVEPGTAGADTTDTTGQCTQHNPKHDVGLPGISFFHIDDPTLDDDLDGNFQNDVDTDGDGIVDITKPYFLNPNIPGATGTIGASGETSTSKLNRWRILVRNIKEAPNAAYVSHNNVSILVLGISEDYGTGFSGQQNEGSVVNGTRLIEQGLTAEPVSIWNNVCFLGITNSELLGTMKYYGSVHMINGQYGTNVLEMSGNVGVFNYYRNAASGLTENPPCCNNGPDASLTNLLAGLPTTRTGVPTLNAKMRIKNGDILIEGSATIGCANDTTRPGKETLDELLTNGTYADADNLHFDRYSVYDVHEDFMDRIQFPDTISNSQKYYDMPRGKTYANYQAYLVGNPDAAAAEDYGALALDLTTINPLNLSTGTLPWVFSTENSAATQESVMLLTNLLAGTGSDTRGGGNANASYITGRSMNWLTRNLASNDNPQGSPLTGGNGTIIYFGFDRYDAATSHEPVIGYQIAGGTLQWVRGGPTGSGTPITLPDQLVNHNGAYFVVKVARYSITQTLVNAIVYIPRDATVSAKFTNFLFHPGSAGTPDEQAAWDAQFSLAPVSGSHKGMIRFMNDFLDVPAQSATINDDVDIDPTTWGLPALSAANSYTYPFLTDSMSGDEMTKSAIIGSGIVLLSGPVYFDTSGSGSGDGTGIDYDGRLSIMVPSWAPTAPVLANPANDSGNNQIFIRTFIYPKTQFPCNDALSLISSGDIDASPNPAQKREALVLYARNKYVVGKQTDLAGSAVAYTYIQGGGSGNPNYLQVPAMNTCMPDFLPGKDPITFTRPTTWMER